MMKTRLHLPSDPVSRKKALEVFAGTDNAYKLAKKYKIKTAFGTDALFDARVASRQGAHTCQDGSLVHTCRSAQDGPPQTMAS